MILSKRINLCNIGRYLKRTKRLSDHKKPSKNKPRIEYLLFTFNSGIYA